MTYSFADPHDAVPACREPGVDPEQWFPLSPVDAEPAVQACRRCPVLTGCERYVEERPDLVTHGVWAATTEWERRDRRRQMRSAA